jgi:Kef-type K+ transport system membrane component KefB
MTHSEDVLFWTLLQLAIIILVARGGNILARRWGNPGAVGEIVVGLLLGPSFLGHVFPGLSSVVFAPATRGTLSIISQIGLIFLMFEIGSEFKFATFLTRDKVAPVVTMAFVSVLAPFGLGLMLGWWSAPFLAPSLNPVTYALFVGLALAITAVPILGRILQDFRLTDTELGVMTISAAAVNDVVGWSALAAISAITAGSLSAGRLVSQIGGLIVIFAALWFVGRPLVRRLLARFPPQAEALSPTLIAICICLQFALGMCTYLAGIFTIFGGFAAGLLFHHDERFVRAWRSQVGRFVLVFFVPVFFTLTGLKTDILGLGHPNEWLWCGAILAVAVAGKIIPVTMTAWCYGAPRAEALVIGVLMNTRALMELIVLNIAYDLGVMPRRVFTMLVIMAVVTTLMTGPLLRWLLPYTRYPLSQRLRSC